MSTNAYGSAVTAMTVRELPGYDDPNKVITRLDLATVARNMIHAEDKFERARAYLNNQEDKYGGFNGVATKGLIYNATGETMKYINHHDYEGHFGESMPPEEIENGQWGVFFHQKPSFVPGASQGAVVYRLSLLDCMMSWWTRWAGQNHCYAEIRERDHFDNTVWGVIADKMWRIKDNQWTEKSYPHEVEIAIGDASICEYSAVVKLLH